MTRLGERVVAVDIGTSKVCVVVGRRTKNGVDVVGFGLHESEGLRKGQVVDIEKTSECIRLAIEEAELMASCDVSSVYVGVCAGHIRGSDGHGMVNVHGSEVDRTDVDRVLEAARLPGPAPGQVLLHTLVQDFSLDAEERIRDPRGMAGRRLEANVHLVMASHSAISNLLKCFERIGVEVEGIVLETLASSHTILDPAEKELGTVLVDIGGGTTDIAIWSRGALVHTAVIALGGDNVTNDVGIGLRVPREQAARLKERHGCAMTDRVDPGELIELPAALGKRAHRKSRGLLAAIIEPRMEEIYRLVRREVELSGYQDALRGGYVLTGGTLAMPYSLELAERTLGQSVRCGVPMGVGGLLDIVKQPKYSAAVGLLLHASQNEDPNAVYQTRQRSFASRISAGFRGLLDRIL